MRYKLYFELEKEEVPLDYHRCILSYIKLSLTEYDKKYFETLYKDNNIKPFTFSVFFNGASFNKDIILVEEKKFELNISTSDYNLAVVLYNSFNNFVNKKFQLNNNHMILKKICLMPERKITTESIKIKFLSPLVVRDRDREARKDYYHSFSSDQFLEKLKININEQIKKCNFSSDILDDFNLIPILPKKTVVKFYEKQIECSLGIYMLHGKKELLEYLYKSGIGSKRSSGFGMFQII